MKLITIVRLSAANLAILTVLGSALPSSAQVQPNHLAQDISLPDAPGIITYNAPPLPPGRGAPSGRRDGGARRGGCEDYSGLTALAPITEGSVWGQTTAAQPTLWFYLPTAVTATTPIALEVQDSDDNSLYSAALAVDAAAGTLAIALPSTVELPVNEPHLWTLSLQCDPGRLAAAPFVQGTIERVAAEGVAPFSMETELGIEQAQAYASQGLWYDALTVLGRRLQTDAANGESQQAWAELLEQVGLAEVAGASVLPCCQFTAAE